MPNHPLVDLVNERVGCGLEVIGIAPQGQSGGAAFVRWPDGRESVVTTGLTSMEHLRQTADVLELVKERGLPVPTHQVMVPVDDGTVAVVQERLPGKPIVESDAATVDAIVAMNERFAGLLAERLDVPVVEDALAEDWRREALEQHSARSRRLLRKIQQLKAFEMTGDDLVQVDLTVPNFLFDQTGEITGVVDWNYGVHRGDRHFGLVKLLFDLSWAAIAPGAEQRPTKDALDRVYEVVHATIDAATLRTYWAHWTVVMISGGVRWGSEDAIQIHLDLGESGL